MHPHLLPCPACGRHVRATEVSCPFCVTALSAAFASAPAPSIPSARIGRAAIMGYRALSATALAATALASCGDDDTSRDMGPGAFDSAYGGPPLDANRPDLGPPEPPLDLGPPMVDAAYGGPPADLGPEPMDLGPPMVDAAYGAPPPRDAAAVEDVGLAQLYGAVPADASASR
ncbi:MAG: hypothetical protein IT379_35440 [Deltaproteobacteria bacterium]|nr:hypothetical protein [Deltaproteobacteria bacterium]